MASERTDRFKSSAALNVIVFVVLGDAHLNGMEPYVIAIRAEVLRETLFCCEWRHGYAKGLRLDFN